MSQAKESSERELAGKIIYQHDVLGMGFRRLSKKLVNEGWKINKDRANRLYNKYKVSVLGDALDDKDLKHLKLAEARQRQRFEVQKEKDEIRRRLTILFVEKSTMSFEQRKRLFTDQEKLLRFARRVMPVTDPALWDAFSDFCQERGYKLAIAVAIALGNQQDYEAQSTLLNGERRFDLYLATEIKKCLADWRTREQNKEAGTEETEREPAVVEEKTEIVPIERYDDVLLQ